MAKAPDRVSQTRAHRFSRRRTGSLCAATMLASIAVGGCCKSTGTLGSCNGGNDEQGLLRYRVNLESCGAGTEVFAQVGTVTDVDPGLAPPVAIGVEYRSKDSRLTVWARPPGTAVFERKVVDLALERDNPIVVRCSAKGVTISHP